jgi:hypothetical protein
MRRAPRSAVALVLKAALRQSQLRCVQLEDVSPFIKGTKRGGIEPMKLAITQRLDDLIAVAKQLQTILDAEDARHPLPTKLLGGVAVDIEQVAAALERRVEALTKYRQQRGAVG